jgi:membrane-associated protease RseP (regulator of RpoE activity)
MTQTHRPDDAGAPPPPPHPMGRPGPSGGSGDETPGQDAAGRVGLVVLLGALAALGFLGGWIYVWVILGVVVMIFLHELGHFVTAKWSGMKVTEFFLSFGPRIWSFRRGETEYGVKAIPAGAYVRIVGMNNLDEVDPADEPRTYRQQSFPKRLLVVSAGSIMHFIQAWILLVLAIGVFGVPGGSISDPDGGDADYWSIAQVTADAPAEAAGFRDGDRILRVDGEPVSEFGDDGLAGAVGQHDVGDELAFTVERDGQERTIDAELGPRPRDVEGGRPGSPFLGVRSSIEYSSEAVGLGDAIVRSPGEMAGFVGDSVVAIGDFFSPSGLGNYADNVSDGANESNQPSSGSSSGGEDDSNRMVSIVGAVRLAAEVSEQGIGMLLIFFFSINVFIGLLNMVPLPPLDGGHAAVAIYERIRSRRGRRYQVDMAKLLPLTYVVVLGLMLLGVTAIYLDVVNPINL